MECRDMKKHLIRYSSGDLPESDRVFVESHLGDCKECGTYLAQSYRAWDMLDEWKEIETGRDYVSEFWKRVSNEETNRRSFLRFLRIPRPQLALAGALATVLIVGIFTFAIFSPDRGMERLTEGDEQDDLILEELDRATSGEVSDALAIYGPWDNEVEIMRINGNGGMN